MLVPTTVLLLLDPMPASKRGTVKIGEKTRVHYKPNKSLKTITDFAVRKIKEEKISMPSAFAWQGKGSSIQKALFEHMNQSGYFHEYWFVTDIKNAFQGVDLWKMADIVESYFPQIKYMPVEGFYKDLPDPLKSYLTYEPLLIKTYLQKFFFTPDKKDGTGLAEGYSSSPILFNLYAEFMIDRQLRKYCEGYGIAYGRFGDNLTFTSDQPIGKKKRRKILSIVRKAGFTINEKKTMHFNLNALNEGKHISGVGLRNRGGQADIFMTGKQRRRLQALLHRAISNKGVNYFEIEGLMGLFKVNTQNSRGLPDWTKAELKVFKMYRQFKRTKKKIRLISGRFDWHEASKKWLHPPEKST